MIIKAGHEVPEVSPADREALEQWAHAGVHGSRVAQRARIVRLFSQGWSVDRIAHHLGITRQTVNKWLRRYGEQGLEGLVPGRRIPDGRLPALAEGERLRVLLEAPPPDGEAWSTRALAERIGRTQTAVSRILRGAALQPDGGLFRPFCRGVEVLSRVADVAALFVGGEDSLLFLELTPAATVGGATPPGHDAEGPALDACVASAPLTRIRSQIEQIEKVLAPASSRCRRRALATFLEAAPRDVAGAGLAIIASRVETCLLPGVRRFLSAHPSCAVVSVPPGISWIDLVVRWLARRSLQGGDLAIVARSLSSQSLARPCADWFPGGGEEAAAPDGSPGIEEPELSPGPASRRARHRPRESRHREPQSSPRPRR